MQSYYEDRYGILKLLALSFPAAPKKQGHQSKGRFSSFRQFKLLLLFQMSVRCSSLRRASALSAEQEPHPFKGSSLRIA